MRSWGSTALLLAAGLGGSSACALVLFLRARHLARSLDSMIRPMHELRGALTALQLGLDAADRPSGRLSALAERREGLRMQLERATLALADLERCRQARAPSVHVVGGDRFDFAAMVVRRGHAWSQIAAAYGSRLQVNWRAGRVSIEGNAGRLKEAVDNLIANALEHGGGRVLVEGERHGTSVRLTISDGGPGPARLSGCSGKELRRLPRGHGLAIARDAVEAHGGKLVAGAGGNGAAVVVELAVAGDHSGEPARCAGTGSRAA